MRSFVAATAAVVSSMLIPAALLPILAAGVHEHHAGHAAVQVTELVRRQATKAHRIHRRTMMRRRPHEDEMRAAAISAHAETESLHRFSDHRLKKSKRNLEWERIVNLTTELQDMKSEYTGLIGVGTTPDGKAQFQARVVFDTGSTNLWVASVLCQASPCDNGKGDGFYNPKKSITEETYTGGRSGDIDIMFGTGELKGPLHVDTYRVGPMVVKQQPFAMIREMTGDVFSSFQFEGILGLAFKSLSFGGITPFFERVIEQKLLTNNEFAFYLNADSEQPSALLWGGVDRDLYEGPITMFPVTQLHYWAIELVEFKIGGKSLGGTRHKNSKLRKLIIDSGTTYFTAPSDLYSQVVSRMPEAACADVEDYKPLTYVLRGKNGDTFELIVTQETYMIGSSGDEGSCRPAFMALDVSEKYGPALILGEVFMRHFFTVFARGDGSPSQARVGFAAAKIGAVPKVSSKASDGSAQDGTVLVESGPAPAKPKERIQKEVIKPCVKGEDCDGGASASLVETDREVDTLRAESMHGKHDLVDGKAASFLQTPKGATRYVRSSPRSQASAAYLQEDGSIASAKAVGAEPTGEKDLQASLSKIRQLDSDSSFAAKLEEELHPGSHTERELQVASDPHARDAKHYWRDHKEAGAAAASAAPGLDALQPLEGLLGAEAPNHRHAAGGLSEAASSQAELEAAVARPHPRKPVEDMKKSLKEARKFATDRDYQPKSGNEGFVVDRRSADDEDSGEHESEKDDDEEDAKRGKLPREVSAASSQVQSLSALQSGGADLRVIDVLGEVSRPANTNTSAALSGLMRRQSRA